MKTKPSHFCFIHKPKISNRIIQETKQSRQKQSRCVIFNADQVINAERMDVVTSRRTDLLTRKKERKKEKERKKGKSMRKRERKKERKKVRKNAEGKKKVKKTAIYRKKREGCKRGERGDGRINKWGGGREI